MVGEWETPRFQRPGVRIRQRSWTSVSRPSSRQAPPPPERSGDSLLRRAGEAGPQTGRLPERHVFAGSDAFPRPRRPPFEAADATMVALKHLKSEAVSLQAFAPHVSGSTAYVINRTLSKDPDKRYQSYDEFIEHLEYARREFTEQASKPKAKQRMVAGYRAGSEALELLHLCDARPAPCGRRRSMVVSQRQWEERGKGGDPGRSGESHLAEIIARPDLRSLRTALLKGHFDEAATGSTRSLSMQRRRNPCATGPTFMKVLPSCSTENSTSLAEHSMRSGSGCSGRRRSPTRTLLQDPRRQGRSADAVPASEIRDFDRETSGTLHAHIR